MPNNSINYNGWYYEFSTDTTDSPFTTNRILISRSAEYIWRDLSSEKKKKKRHDQAARRRMLGLK